MTDIKPANINVEADRPALGAQAFYDACIMVSTKQPWPLSTATVQINNKHLKNKYYLDVLLTVRVYFMCGLILLSGSSLSSGACCCVCLSQARGILYENMRQLSICKRILQTEHQAWAESFTFAHESFGSLAGWVFPVNEGKLLCRIYSWPALLGMCISTK